MPCPYSFVMKKDGADLKPAPALLLIEDLIIFTQRILEPSV